MEGTRVLRDGTKGFRNVWCNYGITTREITQRTHNDPLVSDLSFTRATRHRFGVLSASIKRFFSGKCLLTEQVKEDGKTHRATGRRGEEKNKRGGDRSEEEQKEGKEMMAIIRL